MKSRGGGRWDEDEVHEATAGISPGKRTLTGSLGRATRSISNVPGKRALTDSLPIQRRAIGSMALDGHEAGASARESLAGASEPLPHGDEIQRSFGRHEILSTRVVVGQQAAATAGDLGATAFTQQDRVGFANAPDLRTAAHEAAHVVQQRGGHTPSGGIDTPGDHLEQHADRVADAVVAGESAEPLLDQMDGHSSAAAVQRDTKGEVWQQQFHGESVEVRKLGRVAAPLGIILKKTPTPHSAPASQTIPFDEQIWVERRSPGTDPAKRWAYVVGTGSGASGFIEERFLAVDPPEPTAKLHRVAPGETLGGIASRAYGYLFTAGADQRLYVQALYEANKDRAGIRLDHVDLSFFQSAMRKEAEEETLKVFLGVKVIAGNAIWIPSLLFVQQLQALGKITSGSTELKKAWRTASDVVMAAVHGAEFLAGAIVGILEGVYEAIRDIFKGAWELVKLAFELFKAQVTGGMLGLIKETIEKVRGFIEKFSAKELAHALGDYVSHRWNDSGWYGKGEFVGEIVGYIAANVLLAVLSDGGSLAAVLAEAAEGGSALARAVLLFVKVTDAAANPLKLLKDGTKAVEIGEEAAAKLKQGLKKEAQVAERVEQAPKPHASDPHAPRPEPHPTKQPHPGEQPHPGPHETPIKPRTPAQLAELEKLLPPELKGRLVENHSIPGKGVRVAYKDGVRIEIGPGATAREVEWHIATAKTLLRYEGPLGKIRKLLNAVGAKIGLTQKFGTKGFEAELELKKLHDIKGKLEAAQQRIESTFGKFGEATEISAADAKKLEQEIAGIEAQIKEHEAALNSIQPGRGHIAAEDPTHNAAITKAIEANGGKLGAEIGEGGFGRVYEVPGHPDLVVKLPKLDVGGEINAQLAKEADALGRFHDAGIPTSYKGTVKWKDPSGVERTGILMEKVDGAFSKNVLQQGKHLGSAVKPEHLRLVNERTVADLEALKRTCLERKINIEDLQFMITHDGSIRVIDPARTTFLAESGLKAKTIRAEMKRFENRINEVIRDARDLAAKNKRP